jgi:formylglycine-generating enzyme required for sulfatase activity
MRRFVIAPLLVASSASADHRPIPPGAFFHGLDVQDEAPSSAGVVVLRTPASPRVFVPGATFTMGATTSDAEVAKRLCEAEPLNLLCHADGIERYDITRDIAREMPAHPVTLSAFYLDRTEVTVEAYGRCVAAGRCNAPGFPALDARFDRPDFPVTHVTWDDAKEYCRFAGGRLPTEAEWELAARGQSGRIFPWGKVYNPHLCNHGSFARDTTDGSDGFRGLAPVGSFKDGATPLGILDLAGNAAEWVEDRFEPPLDNPVGYSSKPQTNPVVTKGTFHVIRGGSYDTPSFHVRTTARHFLLGDARRADVGFRCAYDADIGRAPEKQ